MGELLDRIHFLITWNLKFPGSTHWYRQ